MAKPSKKDIVAVLLAAHGRTYCRELSIPLGRNTPSPLFRWLCASILFSARIGAGQAARAAAALADRGWTTAAKMAASTWEQRTKALNESGYARYDESTARMLGDTAALLISDYGGDLRRLRAEAECNPAAERRLLKRCKGLGDVGVDIFFREVQAVWGELYPFADAKALKAAGRLGLGGDAECLARLVDRDRFPHLVAALVRVELAHGHGAVLERAAG
ncbi:MAG: hypothetical protein ACTS3R_09295 [Inquilinaceae bacterium]